MLVSCYVRCDSISFTKWVNIAKILSLVAFSFYRHAYSPVLVALLLFFKKKIAPIKKEVSSYKQSGIALLQTIIFVIVLINA